MTDPDPDWYPEVDERPTTGLRWCMVPGEGLTLQQEWVCRKGDKTWQEWRAVPMVTE
jgi:hypothetical protein